MTAATGSIARQSLAERLEPPAHGLAHAQRHAEGSSSATGGGLERARAPRQHAHHLLQEERIPARRAVHRRHERPRARRRPRSAICMKRATSGSPSPRNGTCWLVRASPPRSRRIAGTRCISQSRWVARIRTADCCSSRAMYCSRRSDDSSAAWRSSRTTSIGRSAASVARTVCTASNSTTRACSGVSSGRSGIQALAGRPGGELRQRAGRGAPRPGRRPARRPRASCPRGRRPQHLHPRPVGGRAAALPAASPEHREAPAPRRVRARAPRAASSRCRARRSGGRGRRDRAAPRRARRRAPPARVRGRRTGRAAIPPDEPRCGRAEDAGAFSTT